MNTVFERSYSGVIDLKNASVSVGQNVQVRLNVDSTFIKQENLLTNDEKLYDTITTKFLSDLAADKIKKPKKGQQNLSDELRAFMAFSYFTIQIKLNKIVPSNINRNSITDLFITPMIKNHFMNDGQILFYNSKGQSLGVKLMQSQGI